MNFLDELLVGHGLKLLPHKLLSSSFMLLAACVQLIQNHSQLTKNLASGVLILDEPFHSGLIFDCKVVKYQTGTPYNGRLLG
jgi:hypothetical protein